MMPCDQRHVLLLDNWDSYTHNLAQLLTLEGVAAHLVVHVVHSDAHHSWAELLASLPRLDAVVVSPGPGRPDEAADFGLCAAAFQSGLPTLGVCLGHQGLACAFGGSVLRIEPYHGRISLVLHTSCRLFDGLPSPFAAVRYHSLAVRPSSLPSCLLVTATAADGGAVMGLRHASLPLYGVQFHPESICSEGGARLVRNFLQIASILPPGDAPPLPPPLPLPPSQPPQPRTEPTPEFYRAESSSTRANGDSTTRLLVCELGAKLGPDTRGGRAGHRQAADWRLPCPASAHRRLYGDAAVSFWLDSSDATSDAPEGAQRKERGNAASFFSYMGALGGPHSYLLRCLADGSLTRTTSRGVVHVLDREVAGGAMAGGATVCGAEAGGALGQALRAALRPWAGATTCRWEEPSSGSSTGEEQVEKVVLDDKERVAEDDNESEKGADGIQALLPTALSFRGGLVGLLAYEAWRQIGPAATAPELRRATAGPTQCAAAASVADDAATFVFADRFVAFDHFRGHVYVLCLVRSEAQEAVAAAAGHEVAADWMARTAHTLRSLAEGPASSALAGPAGQLSAAAAPSTTNSPTIGTGAPAPPPSPHCTFVSDRAELEYRRDIAQVHHWLRSGDSYEICLTSTFRLSPTTGLPPPDQLYHVLRRLNPAPYAAFLRFDPQQALAPASPHAAAHPLSSTLSSSGMVVCCSSPERFLRVSEAGLVESKPIKGTVARSADPVLDARAAASLASSQKERAENLMIVDLIRNDLGRVCVAGSIGVPLLMAIESYTSVDGGHFCDTFTRQAVHQLVSTVRGRLLPGYDAVHAVAAAFPPGSMTGAPKVRTMRLIDTLERSVPRRAYSGSLGFFSIHGASDLNVVIRSALLSGTLDTGSPLCINALPPRDADYRLEIGAGGAVTALSDDDAEWSEVMLKAAASMRAVASAVSGDPSSFSVQSPSR